MNLSEVPDGLGPLQYGAKICEDLGIPQRGNIQMIGESIEAVAKSRLFRGQEHAMRNAYIWLNRRVNAAREQGHKITTLWFHGGEYWNVEKPGSQVPQGPTRYEHHGQGYGEADIKYLLNRYVLTRDALPNRPLTDGEINGILDDLDKKRGSAPAWRR